MGFTWAKAASYYNDLQYALGWRTMAKMTENLLSYDPTKNEVLGDYFGDVMKTIPT